MYIKTSQGSLLMTSFDCTAKKIAKPANKFQPPKNKLKKNCFVESLPKIKSPQNSFSNRIDPVGKHGFPFVLVSRRCTGLFCNSCPTLQ